MNYLWKEEVVLKIFINISLTFVYLILLYLSPTKWFFLIFSILIYICNRPKYILSPRNIVFGYYCLWFGFAPIFADRYSSINYNDVVVINANIFLFITYVVCMSVSMIIETKFEKKEYKRIDVNKEAIGITAKGLILLGSGSLLFFLLYIINTGGISHWLNNLDRAFLTREGAGVYYLGFILIFPLFLYFIRIKFPKSKTVLLYLIVLILVLSPFIGSKQKIIYCFLLIFTSYIIHSKMKLASALYVMIPVVSLFVLGNYFRNSSWMKFDDILAYSFNYFDTYDSLLLFLNNKHQPLEIISVILPLNKIYNFFTGKDEFFDLSAYYTNLYFPDAWRIRATVQFPIEVDLYLSFGYWFGLLPLIFFIASYSIIFIKMLSSRKLVFGFIWFYLFFYLLSHLRGGLFLWTDIYVYPYLIFVYLLFRKVRYNEING